MTTLVDANVLLDVVTEDVEWAEWSATMLAATAARGTLAINPIVYAEISLAFDTIEAHAAVDGFALLTRDASRYRRYFPRLDVIAP